MVIEIDAIFLLKKTKTGQELVCKVGYESDAFSSLANHKSWTSNEEGTMQFHLWIFLQWLWSVGLFEALPVIKNSLSACRSSDTQGNMKQLGVLWQIHIDIEPHLCIISSLSCSRGEKRSLKPVASVSYTHTHTVPFPIVEDLYPVCGVFCNVLIIKFNILCL